MAEVPLSRRPSPILLVIPIILAVAGLGVSVWQYLDHNDKTDGTLVVEQKAERALADEVKKRDAVLARLDALRAVLGYDGEDFQRWLADPEEGVIAGHADFRLAMEARQTRIKDLEGAVGKLQGDINTTATQIGDVQKAKGEMDATKRAEILQKLNDETAVDTSYARLTNDLLKRITDTGELTKVKKAEHAQVARLRAETKKRQDDTLIALQDEVDYQEDVLGDQRSLEQKVDGHVVSVERGSDQVVINLGQRHRIRPGLRFQVVEKGQAASDPERPGAPMIIPRTAEVKGEIEILRVFPAQSLAVVLNVDFSKPIMPDDTIFNPGYAPDYKTRFVLVGRIDLNGDGSHDGELVAQLIDDVRGIIQSDITVGTDFLLRGADWPTTDEPALRNRYHRDQGQIKAAEDLGVSFLSVRRFLDYVGVRVGLDGVVRPMQTGV